MVTCNCTGRCRKPPYTCSGLPEPDLLTAVQRRVHDRAYQRGETNFQDPFEPWVVRSWSAHLDQIGGFEVADAVRQNLINACKIANDPTLTARQKIRKLTKNSTYGTPIRRKKHGKNKQKQ